MYQDLDCLALSQRSHKASASGFFHLLKLSRWTLVDLKISFKTSRMDGGVTDGRMYDELQCPTLTARLAVKILNLKYHGMNTDNVTTAFTNKFLGTSHAAINVSEQCMVSDLLIQ